MGQTSFFVGEGDFEHEPRVGILLSNLGTPDAPTPRALRRYLREFLSDRRVIEMARPLWLPILYLFVLPFRPRRSAALYRGIWTEEGSPLLVNSVSQRESFAERLESRTATPVAVELGMRYGEPSIASALARLRKRGIDRLIVLPLYPQYSSTTTGSTFDAVSSVLQKWRWVPELHVISTFHGHPGYIAALASSIREVWNRDGRPDKLLFSFHGIPKRYVLAGDPYPSFCQTTARLVAEALQLESGDYHVCFQSLFGREEWIRPYTADMLRELGKLRLPSVDVVCPGFTADCLETLEEIDGLDRHEFVSAGGGRYRYIPALNDRADFIDSLVDLILARGGEWLGEGERRKRLSALA